MPSARSSTAAHSVTGAEELEYPNTSVDATVCRMERCIGLPTVAVSRSASNALRHESADDVVHDRSTDSVAPRVALPPRMMGGLPGLSYRRYDGVCRGHRSLVRV